MQAHKVHNESILRVITYYPETVVDIANSFPGLSVKTKFVSTNVGDSPNEHFIWIQCPNENITTALGNLMRTMDLSELPVTDEDNL